MLEFLLGFEHIHHYKEIKKMGDKNDASIARSGERAPKRQPRPEESQDWVIEIWRRRQLSILSAELDEQLGEGRHPEHYIDPVLLDITLPSNTRDCMVFPRMISSIFRPG